MTSQRIYQSELMLEIEFLNPKLCTHFGYIIIIVQPSVLLYRYKTIRNTVVCCSDSLKIKQFLQRYIIMATPAFNPCVLARTLYIIYHIVYIVYMPQNELKYIAKCSSVHYHTCSLFLSKQIYLQLYVYTHTHLIPSPCLFVKWKLFPPKSS